MGRAVLVLLVFAVFGCGALDGGNHNIVTVKCFAEGAEIYSGITDKGLRREFFGRRYVVDKMPGRAVVRLDDRAVCVERKVMDPMAAAEFQLGSAVGRKE